MFVNREVVLGVCPIGKFVFSHEDAKRQARRLYERLDALGVRYVTIDGAVADGIVRSQRDVEPAVAHLRERGIEGLFLPHVNFGTEGAAGMIAKKLNVPTLLWGPRDDAPEADGSRLRDTLCGLFATSGVLVKLGIPFDYIENCRVEDPAFAQELGKFLRVANVVRRFRNLKIGLVGGRIDFFWSCIVSENELLDRFGIQVLPFEMPLVIEAIRARAETHRREYEAELAEMKWLRTDNVPELNDLVVGLAERDELIHLARANGLDALAVQGFDALSLAVGSGAALGTALAAEEILIADESDIHGAISAVMLRAASASDLPNFFPEFVVRHPERDDAACLWHVGAAPSLRRDREAPVEILGPWILPGDKPSSMQFQLRDGALTVCRFDGAQNAYRLGVGQMETVEGPSTRDYYAWVRVDDWRRWERRLIQGPYIHHLAATYDRCGEILARAVRYIPGLELEIFGGMGEED